MVLQSKNPYIPILPGAKIFARKEIFVTPSIDTAVDDRKKPTGFRNFIK